MKVLLVQTDWVGMGVCHLNGAFFFLQVNNPVSILTQEMSKYFLHSKGEGDKYKVIPALCELQPRYIS